MKRIHLYQIVLLIFLLVLLSCARKTTETRGIILGFSQIGAESAWRNYNTQSVREAATEAGVQLLFFNAEQKKENMKI